MKQEHEEPLDDEDRSQASPQHKPLQISPYLKMQKPQFHLPNQDGSTYFSPSSPSSKATPGSNVQVKPPLQRPLASTKDSTVPPR